MKAFGTIITIVLGLGVCALIGLQVVEGIRTLPPALEKPEKPEFVWCVEVDGIVYQSRRRAKVWEDGRVEFWPERLDGAYVLARTKSGTNKRWSAPATTGCNLDWQKEGTP